MADHPTRLVPQRLLHHPATFDKRLPQPALHRPDLLQLRKTISHPLQVSHHLPRLNDSGRRSNQILSVTTHPGSRPQPRRPRRHRRIIHSGQSRNHLIRQTIYDRPQPGSLPQQFIQRHVLNLHRPRSRLRQPACPRPRILGADSRRQRVGQRLRQLLRRRHGTTSSVQTLPCPALHRSLLFTQLGDLRFDGLEPPQLRILVAAQHDASVLQPLFDPRPVDLPRHHRRVRIEHLRDALLKHRLPSRTHRRVDVPDLHPVLTQQLHLPRHRRSARTQHGPRPLVRPDANRVHQRLTRLHQLLPPNNRPGTVIACPQRTGSPPHHSLVLSASSGNSTHRILQPAGARNRRSLRENLPIQFQQSVPVL